MVTGSKTNTGEIKKKKKKKKTIELNPEKSVIDLSGQRKDKAVEGIKEDTRFKDVRDQGVTGSDFGKKKREIFAEEHPTQKTLLDIGSTVALTGATGVLGKAVQAARGVGATAAVARSANAQQAAATATKKLLTHIPKPGVSSKTATNIVEGGRKYALRSISQNGKTYALQKTILQQAASATTNPKVILGLLASGFYTSLFWAPNEKGDALTTISIAQANAMKNGDYEMVYEMDDLMQETLEISASVPVIGFLKAEKAKFAAAAKASEAYRREADKIKEEQERITETGESDFAKEQRENAEAARERVLANREEDEEYFDKIAEEREADKLAGRETDSAYYTKIAEDNRARKLAEREEDEAYYDQL